MSFDEVAKFSEYAAAVYPVMGTSGVYLRGYTGVYDISPDQQPIIDEFSSSGYEGLYCLIGLSGHGFKLSPAFGRIMADFVTGERTVDYDRSIFRIFRFEDGKLLESRYALSTYRLIPRLQISNLSGMSLHWEICVQTPSATNTSFLPTHTSNVFFVNAISISKRNQSRHLKFSPDART